MLFSIGGNSITAGSRADRGAGSAAARMWASPVPGALDQRFRSSNHSGHLVELIGPGVNNRLLIEIVHGSHDPILDFLFGHDADVAEDRAGKFERRSPHEVEPGAILGSEGEFKAVRGLIGEPGFRISGDVHRNDSGGINLIAVWAG